MCIICFILIILFHFVIVYLISSQDIVSLCKLLNMTVKESLGVSDIEILLRKLFNNIQQELSIELTLNMILKCCDMWV